MHRVEGELPSPTEAPAHILAGNIGMHKTDIGPIAVRGESYRNLRGRCGFVLTACVSDDLGPREYETLIRPAIGRC